jgi:hypothetical protein
MAQGHQALQMVLVNQRPYRQEMVLMHRCQEIFAERCMDTNSPLSGNGAPALRSVKSPGMVLANQNEGC